MTRDSEAVQKVFSEACREVGEIEQELANKGFAVRVQNDAPKDWLIVDVYVRLDGPLKYLDHTPTETH
jgi:hypothetical protein